MVFSLTFFWLTAMIVLLIIEAIVPGLVSIWFAIGALAAFVSAMFGSPLWLQVIWFVLVSIIMLIVTRPLAKKYVNGRIKPTNADMAIGSECIVIEEINNIRGTGAVNVLGKIWTARAADDSVIPANSIVVAERIEGVKLIVSRKSV